MKNILLAIILVASAFATVAPTTASAGGYRSHCAPKVYKIRTCEVDRCRYQKWSYDHCGKRYSYWVTVITYKDYYSNGTYKIWKRTIA